MSDREPIGRAPGRRDTRGGLLLEAQKKAQTLSAEASKREAWRTAERSNAPNNIRQLLPDARRALLEVLASHPERSVELACLATFIDLVGLQLGEPDYPESFIREQLALAATGGERGR